LCDFEGFGNKYYYSHRDIIYFKTLHIREKQKTNQTINNNKLSISIRDERNVAHVDYYAQNKD
jgi:hypothetical protein